jgi:mannose-6-phosphate isomerase
MLYPLKFKPVYKEVVWGGQKLKNVLGKKGNLPEKCGESWELSSIEGSISVVENGFLKNNNLEEIIEIYMGELVGDSVYEKFGIEFPLLIKFIDAADDLSVQVHPDNKTAKEKHNAYGKSEMWYVVEADENATLINGFSKKINSEQFLKRQENGELKNVLNSLKVKPSEVFNIPAGRIHSIGKGILLAEVQQTSDVTYRIYDWHRKDLKGNYRELHTDLALDVLDFEPCVNCKIDYENTQNKTNRILKNDFFTVNILDFDKLIEKDYISIDSFVIYICVEGNAEIISDENEIVSIKKGETVLIPADLKDIILNPKTKTKILEVYVELQ